MKKKWLLILLAGAIVAFLAGCEKEITVNTGDAKTNIISVEGIGEVESQPNLAYVFLNIETKNEVSKEAKEKEAKTSNEVIKSLKELGLSDKEIETKNYQINQYREYLGVRGGNEESKEVYQVSHQIKVTINDITKITDVIDQVSGKENVQVSTITYDIKDKEKLIQEAMKTATKNAEERAKQIASAAGTSIQSLNTVTVLNNNNYYPMGERMYDTSLAKSEEPTPITPETQTVKITVQATFNIK